MMALILVVIFVTQSEQQFNELERRDNELTANQAHCTKRAQTLQVGSRSNQGSWWLGRFSVGGTINNET